jgi:hypothetical protein
MRHALECRDEERLWEHWWCVLPLALIVAGVGSVIAAPRLGRTV